MTAGVSLIFANGPTCFIEPQAYEYKNPDGVAAQARCLGGVARAWSGWIRCYADAGGPACSVTDEVHSRAGFEPQIAMPPKST